MATTDTPTWLRYSYRFLESFVSVKVIYVLLALTFALVCLRGDQHCQKCLATPHGSVDGSGRNRSRQSDAEIFALIVVATQREENGLAMLDEAKLAVHVQAKPSLYNKVSHGHSRQQIVYCCEKVRPLKWSWKGGGWNEH